MPNASSRLPKYRKHRASGQAIVTLGGHDFYLGPWGSAISKAEYDRRCAEWMAAGRRLPSDPTTTTIAELVVAFRKHAQNYYKDADGNVSKEAGNFDESLRPVLKLYGKTPAAEFGPLRLKAVRELMIKAGRVRTSINHHISRIRGVFKWAVENELVPASVHHGLMALSGLRRGRCEVQESEPVKPVPVEFVDAVLPHVSKQIAAMIGLQLLTGMRPGEVVLLRGADIDTTGKLWVFKPAKHKTEIHGHSRDIYLGPKARDLLRPFLKTDLSAYLFSPADAEQSRREVLHAARMTPMSCGNKPGTNKSRKPKRIPSQRYTVSAYYLAIQRGCDKTFPPPKHLARGTAPGTGRKSKSLRLETAKEWKERLGQAAWKELRDWQKSHRWFPHRVRHTAATELRKTHGLEAAQVILGHQTLSVTQIYAEKNVAAAMRIMASVG